MENNSNSPNTCRYSVGIAMIATNDYLEKWKIAAKSLDDNAFTKHKNVNLHIFTNKVSEAEIWARSNIRRLKISIHEISGWGWPEATLYRYKFFIEDQMSFTEDILMYCDSDMKVLEEFCNLLVPDSWINGLAFVQHPGFYRNKGLKGLFDLIRNPRLFGPLIHRFKTGSPGLGSWEEYSGSTAYVEPKKRSTYVHGAVWFGKREAFLNLCKILSKNTLDDERKLYIAKWHDESHLNWYLANFGATVLGNELSGVPAFGHIKNIKQRIITLEKELDEGRSPTMVSDLKS
jgi:hypothetical protein